LPRTAEPTVYRITLAPDLGTATFTGSVEVELTLHDRTDRLVANAAELAIEGATVETLSGTHDAQVELDEAAERVTFTLDAPVGPGPALLRCHFTGVLNDKLRGFYRSSFVDQEGQTRTLATTQMESTDARRAFPCWDEPDRKAEFEVTLVVDAELAAFSNSPVIEERPTDDGRRMVRFAPTMKMSTYLVAFIVGPLEVTDPVDVDGVPVRVIHAPGKAHLTGFALEVAAHALRFFAEYFDIGYPAQKLDLAAIPDFAFGAMENLGCVTFRETALLVDPATAARTELERVADVISHEIAHMWFGDLVTMGWWEGIWLNEAFATFMEVLCVDAFQPAWERWVSFGLEREAALAVDGLHATRPIEYPVASPEEANGMFDVLTYQKGGSVLRMLERYLGAEVFRDGVRDYLASHAYANTVTSDLWDALEAASGQPVRSLMDSWILQGGHPLVSLADGRLSQTPFAYRPADPGATSAIGGPWQVPLLLRTLTPADGPAEGGPPERLLLGPDPIPVALDPDRPLVVNAGGWGVYRTSYPPDHLARLARRLAELAPLERAGLLTDGWALLLAGHQSPDDFVDLAAHLGDEDEPSTYGVVAGALGLFDRLIDDGQRPVLEAATRALLGPRAGQLGWDKQAGEKERVPTLRALLLRALGTLGADPEVRAEAARRFDASPVGGGSAAIDPDVEDAVLAVVAAEGRPGDYEAILERYRHPTTPQDEIRHLYALAGFNDAELARRTFQLATTEVRTQNAPYLVSILLTNRVGGPAVWELVKAHWDDLLARFPVNSHPRMLDGARTLCGSPELARDVTRFLAEHPLASGQRTVTQNLERLAVNVDLGRREHDRIVAALSRVAGGAGA
jgi:puromycin-sensitive aminopeptidase